MVEGQFPALRPCLLLCLPLAQTAAILDANIRQSGVLLAQRLQLVLQLAILALQQPDAVHLLVDEFFVGGDDALDELGTAVGAVRRAVLERGRRFGLGEGVVVERLLFLQHAAANDKINNKAGERYSNQEWHTSVD